MQFSRYCFPTIAFHRFQELTETTYRVFFANEEELNRWLRACGWSTVKESAYDEGSYREWIKRDTSQYIRLTEPIFDEDGKLETYPKTSGNDRWLELLAEIDGRQCSYPAGTNMKNGPDFS